MIFLVKTASVSLWTYNPETESSKSPGELDKGDVVIKLYSVTSKNTRHLGSAFLTKHGFGFIDIADEYDLLQC